MTNDLTELSTHRFRFLCYVGTFSLCLLRWVMCYNTTQLLLLLLHTAVTVTHVGTTEHWGHFPIRNQTFPVFPTECQFALAAAGRTLTNIHSCEFTNSHELFSGTNVIMSDLSFRHRFIVWPLSRHHAHLLHLSSLYVCSSGQRSIVKVHCVMVKVVTKQPPVLWTSLTSMPELNPKYECTVCTWHGVYLPGQFCLNINIEQ